MAALRTRADDIRPYGPGSCHTALQTARQGCRALRLRRGPRCHNPPKFFRGMAPAAARRARPVQRGNDQGLRSDRCVPPRARQRLSRNPKGTGRGCTPGSCLLCTACRRHEPPYWGGQGGRSPPALLSPHFFGKKWGPRPGRPVPRGAPRCENVEPLIRRGLAAPPSPLWGEGFGRMISAPTGMAVDTRAGAAALGGPFRLAGSRAARQRCRALLLGLV